MPSRRSPTPAAYGADYTHNLRWGYRAGYGQGTFPEPYRGGGSYGRGYDWAEDRPPDIREREFPGAPESRPRRQHQRRRRRLSRRHSRLYGRMLPNRRRAQYPREHIHPPCPPYPPRRLWPRRGAEPGWAARYERPYRPRYGPPEPRRDRLRRSRRPWRPGTAERDYDRAYPYFASAAALEATSGYPPGETLSPDAYPRGWRPNMTFYGDVY